jgi:prepilin-type N-terminal cleavage/methylation domain-containing protein
MTGSRGFTLIEVMAGLTVSAIVLLVAHEVVAVTSSAAATVRRATAQSNTKFNRELWLTRVFANTVASSRPSRGFQGVAGLKRGGEADAIEFHAVLPRFDSTVVAKIRLHRGPGDQLIASIRVAAVEEALVLATDITAFGAEYLLEYGAQARWVREWVSPATAPIAVRLRMQHATGTVDTLLAPIGRRG